MNYLSLIIQALKTRFVVSVTTFISAIVTYRYFSPDQRGELSLLLAAHVIFFTLIFNAGPILQSRLVNFNLKKKNASVAVDIWASYLIKAIFSIIIFFLSFLADDILGKLLNTETFLPTYVFGFLIILTLIQGPIDETILLGLSKYKSADRIYLLKFFSLLGALSCLFILDLHPSHYFIILCSLEIFTLSLYNWVVFVKLRKIYKLPGRHKLSKLLTSVIAIMKESWSIWVMTVLLVLSTSISTILISKFLTLAEVATYTLFLSLTAMVLSFPTRFETYLHSELSRIYSQKKKAFPEEFLGFLSVYSLLISITFLIWLSISPVIVQLIAGPKYIDSLVYAFLLALYTPLKAFSFYRSVYYIKKEASLVVPLTLIKYFVEFLSYIVLIPLYGIQGVAIGLFISYLFLAILYIYFGGRKLFSKRGLVYSHSMIITNVLIFYIWIAIVYKNFDYSFDGYHVYVTITVLSIYLFQLLKKLNKI